MKKIMFVCLGNICRSPLARVIMEDIIKKNNKTNDFLIDSSGTSAWHVDEEANYHIKKIAMYHGIKQFTHSAKQFKKEYLEMFDYIFAMDRSNEENIISLDKNKEHLQKIHLFREFDPMANSKDVPDPYYGGDKGFEDVFVIVKRNCELIYEKILSGEL